MYRNMSVDDMSFLRIQTKLPEHSVYYFFIFQKMIIRTFYFFMGSRIFNKIPFKSSHLVLAKQRRIRACPDKPENIPALPLFFIIHSKKSSPDISFQHIIKFFAFISFAVDLHFFQTAIFIKGNTAMEKKIAIVNLI